MKRKSMSLLLTAIMMFSMFNTEAFASEAAPLESETSQPEGETLLMEGGPSEGIGYEVLTEEEFNQAVTDITNSAGTEATIVFGADQIDVDGFSGIPDKHIYLKSTEGHNYEILKMGTNLSGDLTFDNVICYNRGAVIFANGHLFETTGRFSNQPASPYVSRPTLYGGGNGTDVEGDTQILLRSGIFAMMYGGGKDGNVSGSVFLTLEGDADSPDCSYGTVFGGGLATDKNIRKGCVGGDVHLNFISGNAGMMYGGGSNGTTSAKDYRETAARVDGDIYIAVGSADKFSAPAPGSDLTNPQNYVQGACLTAVDLYGGGQISSVGKVNISIENGTFLCEKTNLPGSIGWAQTKSLIGGGESSIVRETVNIEINGGLLGSVMAGGSTWSSYGIHNEINNEKNEKYATHLVINGGVAETIYPHGQTVNSPAGLQDEQIKGSTLIEFNGGLVSSFVLSRAFTEIYGDSRLIVRGGGTMAVPAVYGYETFEPANVAGITEVIFDGCGGTSPQGGDQFLEFVQIKDIDSVKLMNGAKVSAVYLGFSSGKPAFNNVTNLIIDAGSTLALDAPAEINGDLELNGTLAQSRALMDNYMDLVGIPPSTVFPAVLTVKGKAAGSGNVLAMKADKWLDDDVADNEVIPLRPVVGEIYIKAQKTGSTADYTLKNEENDLFLKRIDQPDSPSDRYAWQIASGYTVIYDKNEGDTEASPSKTTIEVQDPDAAYTVGTLPAPPARAGYTFTGWNTKPNGSGTEFKADTPVTNSITVYAQWEKVMSGNIVLTPVDIVAYTGGDSMGNDPFPTIRYEIDAPQDVDVTGLKLTIEGKECQGHLVEPGADKTYCVIPDLKNSFSFNRDVRRTGNSAANDAVAGTYSVTVANGDNVTASNGTDSYGVQFGNAGKLTVRHLSNPHEVLNNTLDVAKPIENTESSVNTDDGIAVAVIPDGANFYTNGQGSGLGLLGNNREDPIQNPQIALLFDDIVPLGGTVEERTGLLIDHANKKGYVMTEGQYQFKYLDIINENDGNTWVSTDKDITIFWPYPEAVKDNYNDYTFSLLHFTGLHREYSDSVENDVEKSVVENITSVEKTDKGLKFIMKADADKGCFSPFALQWVKNTTGGNTTKYYDLTFKTNGGSSVPAISVEEYTTVQLTQIPVRDAYTFEGWYSDENLSQKITSVYMDGNKTVYAKWTVIQKDPPSDPEKPVNPSGPTGPSEPSKPGSPAEGEGRVEAPETSDSARAGLWLATSLLSGWCVLWIRRRKSFQ